MHRDRAGLRDGAPAFVEHGGGRVQRLRHDGRVGAAQDGIFHFVRHRIEAAAEDFHGDRIDGGFCGAHLMVSISCGLV